MSCERALKLQDRARRLYAEGKLDRAMDNCEEALRLMKASVGATSPHLPGLLNQIADIECQRQNATSALAHALHAQQIEDCFRWNFKGEIGTQVRIHTLDLLGTIYRIRGEYTNAEQALQKALDLSLTEFGEGSEELAQARNNLGVLYKYSGNFPLGMQLYRLALPKMMAIYGDESLPVALVYHNIGGILHTSGDFAGAEEPARKAWHISRQLLGEGDPRSLQDGAAYAAILCDLKRYEESEAIYRHALAIFERTLGREHYEVAAALHGLATSLAGRGCLVEAEANYRRALKIEEILLGPDCPDLALTKNNFGMLLLDAGRPCEAVSLLESAVLILEKRLPAQHPHVIRVGKNLTTAREQAFALILDAQRTS